MAALFKVKALFDYSSPHEDDLSFESGQVISVTDQDDDDWYGGEYLDSAGEKKEGIFPRNFVEKIEPTAPPRPTRSRTKKADVADPEQEPESAPQQADSPPPQPSVDPVPEPEPEEEEEQEQEPKTTERAPVETPVSPAASKPPPPAAEPPADQQASEPQRAPAQLPVAAAKSKPSGPPPVAQKPTTNSFKDRIAAFNKADAAPITPFKPGRTGTDSFIKKPFVPPPPSRHAYVPPPVAKEAPIPTGYRREEDPEIQEQENQNLEQAEKAGLLPSDVPKAEEGEGEGDDEDQPKPTSLKERIALLQKQQMEQAQRHAEAAAKKDKAKKPPVPKKRSEAPPPIPTDKAPEAEDDEGELDPAPLQRTDTETTVGRKSVDASQPLQSPPPPRRKSSKGPAVESPHDGNEADMSGAGDTTEGQDDGSDHDDTDDAPLARPPAVPRRDPSPEPAAPAGGDDAQEQPEGEEEEEEEEEEEDVDPEVRRKEELRARMAKMSGGMGFHGMFGAGAPPPMGGAPPPKKKSSKSEKSATPADEDTEQVSRAAPPIPTPMALPGMGRGMSSPQAKDEDDDEVEEEEEVQEQRAAPPRALPTRPPPPPARPSPGDDEKEDEDNEDDVPTPHVPDSQAPPIPPGRPAPPPVPAEGRPPPPPPPADVKSASDGSQSDDELSSSQREKRAPAMTSAPQPPTLPPAPARPVNSPPASPRVDSNDDSVSKRNSRAPPPIPGFAPPPPGASRPPPPPPPGELSRQSTIDRQAPPPLPTTGPAPQAGEDADAEVTEYEGDYDTDIGSSVPHKDALKAHARDSSIDEALQSPVSETKPSGPPPLPPTSPRAVPPPLPSQAPPQPQSKRSSVDAPRAAPPPPPPAKEAADDQFGTGEAGRPEQSRKTPKIEEEAYFTGTSPPLPQSPGLDRRVPPTTPGGGTRNFSRQSTEGPRMSTSNRRSADFNRPSIDSGFIANDIDLAPQSGWWRQSNQLPPYLQGRRDVYFESSESTTTNQGAKTVITREIFVLYQDYSQTVIRAAYDPYEPSDVDLEQRHEPPPRPLRQDEMEEFYDRFGRQIADVATGKKDSIVGDGTPHSFVHELLRPLNGALQPIGTRSFGALVYSNMANASTQQNDVIRPGDILSVRNGKFQGKHGPMHAKYSAEVGKPDHVAVVSEWDGTKKKVRAWEQGRENKKVKVESYKLDDLRSGEVKIWRVVPRSWVGWNSQP